MKVSLIILALILSGCTKPDAARQALESNGFTNIQLDGYSIFGCGKDDYFSDKFTATGANGKQVTGVVCSGWFKGSTIRMD